MLELATAAALTALFLVGFVLTMPWGADFEPKIALVMPKDTVYGTLSPELTYLQGFIAAFERALGKLPYDIPDSPPKCFEIRQGQFTCWLAIAMRDGIVRLHAQTASAGQLPADILADHFSSSSGFLKICRAVESQIDRALVDAAKAQGIYVCQIY